MKIKSYAKINLALDVLKKTNQGYHEISTVFQNIDLHDILDFRLLKEPKIILKSNNKVLMKDPHNTVFKAIRILQERLKKLPTGLHISLQKNIPIGAGLGGGSSNGSVTLLALNQLWKLGLTQEELMNMAKKIGMDAPFFIQGGTAFGTHFGEKLQQLSPLKKIPMLLILQSNAKSTAKAYKKIGKMAHGKNKQKTISLVQALKNKSSIKKLLEFFHNDFNILYGKKFIMLSKKLLRLGAKSVQCSGSGTAVYAVFDQPKIRNKAYQELKRTNIHVLKIKTWYTTNPTKNSSFNDKRS